MYLLWSSTASSDSEELPPDTDVHGVAQAQPSASSSGPDLGRGSGKPSCPATPISDHGAAAAALDVPHLAAGESRLCGGFASHPGCTDDGAAQANAKAAG